MFKISAFYPSILAKFQICHMVNWTIVKFENLPFSSQKIPAQLLNGDFLSTTIFFNANLSP